MSELFASGRIADLILIVLALEAVTLGVLRRRTGRGVPVAELLAFLVAGACLVLALRGALVGAWWGWIGLSLAGALVAHLADLRLRWRR